MYKRILDYLKNRPKEYEVSTNKFWDDEHISKYMLEAHLNPDVDSASRRHESIRRSAVWISGLVSSPMGKKLLDLGCGPGLYTSLFDDLGFEVTGVDFSKRSIAYAKEQARLADKRIDYHYQNYLEIDYDNQFNVITLIYCDFGVLKPADRHSLLCKAKKALKPDGILILDGFTEMQYADFKESQTVEYEDTGFWSCEPYVCIQRNFRYEQTKTYLEQYIIITEGSCNRYNLWNGVFDRVSLSDELKRAGFEDFQYFGDVCGESYSESSNTICVVAR